MVFQLHSSAATEWELAKAKAEQLETVLTADQRPEAQTVDSMIRDLAAAMQLPPDMLRSKAEMTATETQLRQVQRQQEKSELQRIQRLLALQEIAADLQLRRRRLYRALLDLMAAAPLPTLLYHPATETAPEHWEPLARTEPPEATRAKSLLLVLQQELLRTLREMAELMELGEWQTEAMIRKAMAPPDPRAN